MPASSAQAVRQKKRAEILFCPWRADNVDESGHFKDGPSVCAKIQVCAERRFASTADRLTGRAERKLIKEDID